VSARGIVTGLTGTAVSAVRHPFRTTGRVVGGAKVVVATGTSVAGSAARSATSHLHHGKNTEGAGTPATRPDDQQAAEQQAGEEQAAEPMAPEGDAAAGTQTVEEPQVVEPQVVLREPGPPLEPPIDVVGEALAAEAEEPSYGGHATEPKATTRDEEHGDAGLQRAEIEEIAEEMAEAFPAGEIDVETPVGTTGADVGHNPDTAEADLQQPGTAPLVDDATVKAIKSETKTGRKAARSKKS
jgi:hypothetical protein